MDQQMRRFLASIGIESGLEDLSFESFGWKKYEGSKIMNLVIRKENPWNGSEYFRFEEGLSSISYDYEISFVYGKEPTIEEISSLLRDWHFNRFRTNPPFTLEKKDGNGIVCRPKEGVDETLVNESFSAFEELLSYLRYNFFIELEDKETTPVKEEPSHNEPEPIDTHFEEPHVEQTHDDAHTSAAFVELDEDEKKAYDEAARETADIYARSIKEELVDQSNRLAWRRGNYDHLDNISIINSMNNGNVEIEGEVFSLNMRSNSKGPLLILGVGNMSGAVNVRAGARMTGLTGEQLAEFEVGDYVRVQGAVTISNFTYEKQLTAHKLEKCDRPAARTDDYPRKRAELHVHTTMSAMDAVAKPDAYFRAAKAMGLEALAFVDHGVVQAFPLIERAAKKAGVKPIYGCEFNMVNEPVIGFNPSKASLRKARYCVFDFETTGLSSRYDHATEFGCVIVENGTIVRNYDTFIDPGVKIPEHIVLKTHITDEMVKGAPNEIEAAKLIDEVIGDEDTILVSHNAPFDVGFLNVMRKKAGMGPIKNPVIDTLALSHYLFPNSKFHNLGALSRNLKLQVYDTDKAHRADFDAEVLYDCWQALLPLLEKGHGIGLLHEDLLKIKGNDAGVYKHMKPVHVCSLAKNQAGIKALYELVSLSHTKYLSSGSIPKIPRFEIESHRENLLLGTACFNGEVFTAALQKSREEAVELMSFYDYVEVQPLANYTYLINDHQATEEQLKEVIKDLVDGAAEMNKTCVATGDAHYVDPSDKIIRDVYIFQDGVNNMRHPLRIGPGPSRRLKEIKPDRIIKRYENPDQHLRTTSEMIEAFTPLLGKGKAEEIVIDSSLDISSKIEPVKILKDRLYAPTSNLPGTDEKLRQIVDGNFKIRYGEHPDQRLIDRKERELKGIIENGYSVTYYIAHRLVKKANEDGYIVGSRGSVGSSFVALLAGISEVNPLPPHYLCPKCKKLIWSEDPAIRSGFDLPSMKCPDCGTEMNPDGQNIPFETFLGFEAEKVPDIDLNFANDYQARAFAYTRELLSTPEENEKIARGEELDSPHVIRAGTISEAQDKNCFVYVKDYISDVLQLDLEKVPRAYISYLAYRCSGVKRTTGQHPGGIVVIPADMDITDFTPFQHPSDDPSSDWLTTHFEFKSMHDSVLKIDELGHFDPQALREMSLLTGVDVTKIPMNDRDVLSLFSSTKALNLKRNPLHFKTGSVALPEFGTDFVQQILDTVLPKSFNDLLIISGLSHGTNVWHSNSEDYINSGQATLQEVIGCRDDIMNYLIGCGMPSKEAFQIMESVRHGSGLSEEWMTEMRSHGVPGWYIDSCNKIQYLFPRAHASAYVIAAVRVAWFKLYRPLEFYAVYYATRCDAFDLEAMTGGMNKCVETYERLLALKNAKSPDYKDRDGEVMKSLAATIELYDRGYSIRKVDLYRSDSADWVVDGENKCIYAPFKSVPNLSENAALSVVEARKDGEFISVEDLKDRTSLSYSDIDRLRALGTLDGLDETNQLTLF